VVVGSALVDAVRHSLHADGRPTELTVGSVVAIVEDIAKGVRSVKK
ncbi:MAG: hypothetical protein RLZZ496_1367, partial [Pseudomonadota bacterium]